MADRWQRLGVQLGLDINGLKALSKKNPSDPEQCLMDMLDMWLKQKGSAATWAIIVEAIQAIGDNALAENIAKKHS